MAVVLADDRFDRGDGSEPACAMATIRSGSGRDRCGLSVRIASHLRCADDCGGGAVPLRSLVMQSYANIKERFLDQQGVESIAAHLAIRAELNVGLDVLGERRDLQPAAEAALGELFADRLAPNRKVVIPIWERVGPR
jgi:hypothetical protein